MPGAHIPVLLDEILAQLDPKPGDDLIDATLGGGGHASALLEATGPDGRLLGIERDGRTLEETRKRLESRFGSRAVLVHGSYRDIASFARSCAFPSVSGILFDLGYSSFQIDDPSRGFSFRLEGPLDMRFDETQELTAAEIVNGWPKEDLARILRRYGEERGAGRIADAIVRARRKERLLTTGQLAAVVAATVGRRGKSDVHPATQTFQALRIAVNDELGGLEEALPAAADLLKPGGRLAIISFHSLEDRIVKNFLKERPDLEAMTKKPIVPQEEEIERNRRARSAKLRIAVKR